MRIVKLPTEPVHELLFINAKRGGGTQTERLPILRGHVDRLPDGVDALLITSDLQGVAPSWRSGGESVLLGEALADELDTLTSLGHLPDSSGVGALLAGDLYSAPGGDKRGASGDVRSVWYAFSAVCRWVAGVAGNHDRFGTERELVRLQNEDNVHLLDGDAVEIDDLCIGGVGGIIGNPKKPGRRSEDDFLDALNRAIDPQPTIMMLHQGPNGDAGQTGDELIRETLELSEIPLVVCGHSHWDTPMTEIANGVQVLNVDARVVLLTALA